jgi:hypothetical protein
MVELELEAQSGGESGELESWRAEDEELKRVR